MKNISKYNATFLKQIFAFGLVFFVLISTCSIQNGLKSIFGAPMEMAKTAKNAKIATASFGGFAGINQANCVNCADLQVLTADSQSLFKNIGPAVLMVAVFSLFLHLFSFKEENSPIFKTPHLTDGVPKYLLFSKLLFYDKQ